MKTTFLLAIGLAPGMLCAQQCPLQNGTLKGVYVMTFTGTGGGPAFNNVTGAFAAVGKIVFDGAGNLKVTSTTVSFNNAVNRGVTIPGSYTVNSDCTGTQVWAGGGVNMDMVLSPNGKQITMIQTDKSTALTGTALRLTQDTGSPTGS